MGSQVTLHTYQKFVKPIMISAVKWCMLTIQEPYRRHSWSVVGNAKQTYEVYYAPGHMYDLCQLGSYYGRG